MSGWKEICFIHGFLLEPERKQMISAPQHWRKSSLTYVHSGKTCTYIMLITSASIRYCLWDMASMGYNFYGIYIYGIYFYRGLKFLNYDFYCCIKYMKMQVYINKKCKIWIKRFFNHNTLIGIMNMLWKIHLFGLRIDVY
jgi:hypothetical protein